MAINQAKASTPSYLSIGFNSVMAGASTYMSGKSAGLDKTSVGSFFSSGATSTATTG